MGVGISLNECAGVNEGAHESLCLMFQFPLQSYSFTDQPYLWNLLIEFIYPEISLISTAFHRDFILQP